MPHRGGNKRTGIVATFVLTLLFVAVTSIIVFAKGNEHFLRGFTFVGVALLLLFISTAFLLNFVRTDDAIEDKVRYFAVFQSLSLFLLCVSILVVIYEPGAPPVTCPEIPTPTCDLSLASNSTASCQTTQPGCFLSGGVVPVYFHVNESCPCAYGHGYCGVP